MINLQKFQAGEIIIREGEPGEQAYFIEQGKVEVSKDLDGKKVHLAFLNEGEPFGEMGMIDEKPRSATITAVEDTTVSTVHRDDFFKSLQTNPDTAVNILRALFERLREANTMVLQLKSRQAETDQTAEIQTADSPISDKLSVELVGLTEEAAIALPSRPCIIDYFPCRIGRKSHDPLAINDLVLITQSLPHQVSRNHAKFIRQGESIGVIDRGSTLGCLVNDRRIGGYSGSPGPVFLRDGENELVLGNEDSQIRYLARV